MNCKPGDLAIVVGAGSPISTPGLKGRVVEIVRAAIKNEMFPTVDGIPFRTTTTRFCWVVRSPRPLPWISINGPHEGRVHMVHERPIADSAMRPISGVPVNDEATEEITA
jgi:hypothetical protein